MNDLRATASLSNASRSQSSLKVPRLGMTKQHSSLSTLSCSTSSLFEMKRKTPNNTNYLRSGSVTFRLNNFNMKINNSLPNIQASNPRSSVIVKKVTGDASFVTKVPRYEQNSTLYRASLDCLKNEAEILSQLSHENIIKIHEESTFLQGTACADVNHVLLLEELETNLAKSLVEFWTTEKTQGHNSTFLERIDILFDLASALHYLHSKKIIHRDIKPANVGFNSNGVLKLSGFESSVCLKNKQKFCNDLYRLEGFHGSFRYQAPESFHCSLYNEASDVYSFGILMWEVLSLRKPFKGLSKEKWQRGIRKGERPPLLDSWPQAMKTLIQNCWSTRVTKRPPFKLVLDVLRVQMCGWTQ